jgi:type I restriction enzyme, S subunit
MGGYRRYEAYQDSGVELSGEIPAHWKVCLVKRYFNVEIGRMLNRAKSVEDGITKPYLRAANIHWNEVRLDSINEMEFPEKQLARYQLQTGDLLVTEGGVTVGRSAIWKGQLEECYYQNSVNRVRPHCTDSASVSFLLYWMYFVKSNGYIDLAADMATFGHLTQEKLQSLPMSLPPLEEQKSIARFLDYKTAQIDALIAKKESLLKKLAEKRSALISQAVTKGLDPTVPMKDSGVEWLGEIPAHWKVGALGYMCNLVSGGTPDRNKVEFWDGEIPWIKTGEINYQDINDSEERITNLGLANSSACIASPGTLLMAMYGQGNTRGRVSILRIHAAFNQACIAISPQQNINVEFLYYYMIAAYPYIRDSGNESSQMNLSAGLIGKIKIVILPLSEQESLVNYLSQSIRQLDKQMDKVRLAIARLKEYRTALITNAVTGAIDVRNVAIPNDLQEAAS